MCVFVRTRAVQWLLDYFGCNAIGIFLGHWTLKWLNSKEYNWTGIRQIPSIGGKLQRGLLQFTPASWVRYRWAVRSFLRKIVVRDRMY